MTKFLVSQTVAPTAERLGQAPVMRRLMDRTPWFRFPARLLVVVSPAAAGFEASVAQMVAAPPVRPEVLGSIPDC